MYYVKTRRQTSIRAAILGVVALLLAACGVTSTDQQTLAAFESTATVQVDNLRATATAQRERLQVTVGALETQIARATSDLRAMRSTLDARGIDTGTLPEAATLPPTVAAQPGSAANPTAPLRVEVTPFTPTPDLTRISQQAGLSNLVLSTGVNEDDCASNATNRFTVETAEIYIVGVANFPQDTDVRFRWEREGELLADINWTYGPTDVACIWYFVDETDFTFTPGEYRVTVTANGVTLPALPFRIAG